MENLIPFRVRLATFEELLPDLPRPINYQSLSRNDFLRILSSSSSFDSIFRELKQKLMTDTFEVALQKTYDAFRESNEGEWIVVGKDRGMYLAGQPGKIARRLPASCCIFLGPLEANGGFHGMGI